MLAETAFIETSFAPRRGKYAGETQSPRGERKFGHFSGKNPKKKKHFTLPPPWGRTVPPDYPPVNLGLSDFRFNRFVPAALGFHRPATIDTVPGRLADTEETSRKRAGRVRIFTDKSTMGGGSTTHEVPVLDSWWL